ncbi:MAG: hypothetical protein K2W82_15515 [Candidatus Obscuribacterales bacterium]|nr:hypothetical protein [Candidatus Obscuribacterales bacterium]
MNAEKSLPFRPLHYAGNKTYPIINCLQEDAHPLLLSLTEAMRAAEDSQRLFSTDHGPLHSCKGQLNERQYAERVEKLSGTDLQKLEKLVREQNNLRCSYAMELVALGYSLPEDKRRLEHLNQVLVQVAEFASRLECTDEKARHVRNVYINNCLLARQLIAFAKERRAKLIPELNSPCAKTSLDALNTAYEEDGRFLGSVDLDRLHGKYIRGLSDQAFERLETLFDYARSLYWQAEMALKLLKEKRGMLHEDQFLQQVEKAATNGGHELTAIRQTQTERRRLFVSAATAYASPAQALQESLDELKIGLEAARSFIEESPPQERQTLLVMKSNCVAARSLLHTCALSLARHPVDHETDRDPLFLKARATFDEALLELLKPVTI